MCSRVAQADQEKDRLVHLAEREADLKVTLCRACSCLLPEHRMLSSPTTTSNNQLSCLQVAEIRLQANAALKAAHRDKLHGQRQVSDLQRQACIVCPGLQAGLLARLNWLLCCQVHMAESQQSAAAQKAKAYEKQLQVAATEAQQQRELCSNLQAELMVLQSKLADEEQLASTQVQTLQSELAVLQVCKLGW